MDSAVLLKSCIQQKKPDEHKKDADIADLICRCHQTVTDSRMPESLNPAGKEIRLFPAFIKHRGEENTSPRPLAYGLL